MSLIDDALKRAQEASSGKQPEGENQRPWTPPPLPDAGRGGARSRVLAACALTAAAGFTLYLILRSGHNPSKTPRASAKSPASSQLPPILSEVTVAPPPRGIASSRAVVTPVQQSATRLPPSASGVRTALGTTGPAGSAPSPHSARSESPASSKPHGPEQPRTYVTEMPLPGGAKITLDGIVFSEGNPIAVLNGRVLPPGGVIEGFTVSKIFPDKVELDGEAGKVVLTLR